MRRIAYTTAVVVSLLALTACATGTGSTSAPSTSPSVASSVSPSPAATENAEGAVASPASWVLSSATVGPLTLGMSGADARASVPEAVHMCHDTVYAIPSDDPQKSLWMIEQDGVLTAVVSFLASGPQTADGIGVGSTRDDVTSAYPDARFEARNLGWLVSGELLFGFTQGIEYNVDGSQTDRRSGSDAVIAVGTSSTGPLWEFCG